MPRQVEDSLPDRLRGIIVPMALECARDPLIRLRLISYRSLASVSTTLELREMPTRNRHHER